jgi:opacity protein-like surface antigen
MSKKLVLSVGAILIFAPQVYAEDGFYAAVGGGISFAEDLDFSAEGETVTTELDTGFIVGGALGYQLQAFRLEGEFAFLQNDVDKLSAMGISLGADGDVSVMSGFANVYFDFDTMTPWTPYIGGGVGIANVANDVSVMGIQLVDDDDSVFAYQVKAGVSYSVNPTTDVTVGYRFLGTDDVSLKTVDGFSIQGDGPQSHNLEAGIRFRF